MSNIAKWVAGSGVGLTWTACFGAEVNSLGTGYVAVSGTTVANGTPLDLYADVSFSLTGTTSAAPAVASFSLYLLPLNQDGSTFGDGSVSGSVNPSGAYFAQTAVVQAGVSGAALTGMFQGVRLPPGSFRFAIVNGTQNALSASGNTVKYRTYNENLNG